MGLFKRKPKTTISIDIGNKEIKFAEGKHTKKGTVVVKTFKADTPEGSYKDGDLLNTEVISRLIKRVLSNNNVSTDYAHIVVNSSKIVTREIEIPKVKESEVNALVNFQLDTYIPVNPNEFTVRTLLIGYTTKEDGTELMKMVLVGVPNEMIVEHHKLLEASGLKPIRMDYQGNALRKLFVTSNKLNNNYNLSGKTIAVVDMGFNSTNITVVDDGELKVSRVIEVAYDKEDDSSIKTIADRLETVLKYYKTRDNENKVDLIVLVGGSASEPKIEEKLGQYLDTEVCVLEQLDAIEYDGTDIYNFADAIGGLIRLDEV